MTRVEGSKIIYIAPNGTEKMFYHHDRNPQHAYQSSDNSRLFIECVPSAGTTIIEEWAVDNNANPQKISERTA